jgi:hypothetical protein
MNVNSDKLMNFLPEVGILIFSSAFLLPWFSCIDKNIFYLDLIRPNSELQAIGFYPSFKSHFYLLCFTAALYLFTKFLPKRTLLGYSLGLLILGLFLLCLYALLILWIMQEFGVHQTTDIPCSPMLGFQISLLGLIAIIVGILFRFKKVLDSRL